MTHAGSASSDSLAVNNRPRLPEGWSLWLAGVLGVYLVTLLLIRPEDYSDTFNYAKHIVDQHYLPAQPQGSAFWDFGHVLWRPMGYMVWSPFRGVLAKAFGGDELLAAGAVLISLSIVGGLTGAVFLFLLAARTTRSPAAAAIATVGYLSTNAILHYQLTGMSYVAGLACQIAGLYYLHRSITERRLGFARGIAAGLPLGLSVVVWFPYVLSLPGIFCYALLVREGDDIPDFRRRAALLVGLAAGAAAVVMVVYGCAMAAGHFTSVASVSNWIARSRYDKLPNRGVLRMLGSIPRGFFSLGQGSTAWKRMLFEHRILSPVDLIRTGIWKVALVYLALAASVHALWRSVWGRRLLVCLFVTALPIAIFAAFLFEATPPERYMAAFPLLFLGFAWIMADPGAGRIVRFALAAFFACTLAVNVTALLRFREPAEFESARIELRALNDRIAPHDCIVVLSLQDPVVRLVEARPFSPSSRIRFQYFSPVPWGSAHPESWRRVVAERVETAWKNGGRAWLANRFLADLPDPAWGWVEGDDRRIRWSDFHLFFERLDLGNAFGGTDGFSEILPTERNRLVFDSSQLPGDSGASGR